MQWQDNISNQSVSRKGLVHIKCSSNPVLRANINIDFKSSFYLLNNHYGASRVLPCPREITGQAITRRFWKLFPVRIKSGEGDLKEDAELRALCNGEQTSPAAGSEFRETAQMLADHDEEILSQTFLGRGRLVHRH